MIRGALVISFDAFFWGIVREARIMDPQHRKLEVAWMRRVCGCVRTSLMLPELLMMLVFLRQQALMVT